MGLVDSAAIPGSSSPTSRDTSQSKNRKASSLTATKTSQQQKQMQQNAQVKSPAPNTKLAYTPMANVTMGASTRMIPKHLKSSSPSPPVPARKISNSKKEAQPEVEASTTPISPVVASAKKHTKTTSASGTSSSRMIMPSFFSSSNISSSKTATKNKKYKEPEK